MRALSSVALAALLLMPASAQGQTWAEADFGGSATARAGFASAVFATGGELFVGSPGAFAFFPMPANRPGALIAYGPDNHSGMGFGPYQTLAATDGTAGDQFGLAVHVAGDRMVVGAPGAAGGQGRVYRYVRSPDGLTWDERTPAMRLQGEDTGLDFGRAVALTDDEAIVGAPGWEEHNGAVMVSGPTGITMLQPDSPIPGERFGRSVSVLGNWLAVGAPGPDLDALAGIFGAAPSFMPGSVYLFEKTEAGWTQRAHLTEAEAGPAMLGASVLLTTDGLFAGAPLAGGAVGEVRHWTESMGNWTAQPAISVELAGQGFFGQALSHSGSRLMVGAPLADVVATFTAGPDGAWALEQRFDSDAPGGFFGSSVALSNSSAWVGAPGALLFTGEAREYQLGSDGWTEADPIQSPPEGATPITGELTECNADGRAAGYQCTDVDMVAFIPLEIAGADAGTMANDVWGWTDPQDGKEYVLMGMTDRTVFIDISDAGNPRILGALAMTEGSQENLWRDMKVYDNHAFIVADGAGAHGIQVFDLTKLRGLEADPERAFEEDGHYSEIFSAHNIVINEESGFAYVVGASSGGTTCGGGLHMVDIRDPKNPTFAGCFQDASTGQAGTGYSHDAQCINYRGPDLDYANAEICFGANETALSIADVTDKSAPRVISSAGYPSSAYLHQGWVSDDHAWFFMNDEGDEIAGTVPKTRTLVWDIADLDDPILVNEHMGTTSATDHNLYVHENLMYQANYVSGLRILDVSDPENPVEVAYFDTVPVGDDSPGFAGAFSNYPFFESGTIAVTSMREGLFLLKRKVRRTVFDR